LREFRPFQPGSFRSCGQLAPLRSEADCKLSESRAAMVLGFRGEVSHHP
jgi:hypothetical protein